MTGFSQAIFDGNGNLLVPGAQSPNFVAGSTGWQIRQDGSVEFNNGVFRGVIRNGGMFIYQGTPALGNLIFALTPTGGTDPFGNTYLAGFNLSRGTNTLTAAGLVWTLNQDVADTILPQIAQNDVTTGHPPDHSALVIDGPGVTAGASLTLYDQSGLAVCGGPPGLYYNFEGHYALTAVNGVSTQVAALASDHLNSDYPAAISAGVFTAPVSSYYSSTHINDNLVNNATRSFIDIQRNGVTIAVSYSSTASGFTTGLPMSCTADSFWMNAGDTLTYHCLQASGANVATSGRVTIRRQT